MTTLLLLLVMSGAPDGGEEVSFDGGRCVMRFDQGETKCTYEGSKEVLNPKTGKWRRSEFEGSMPCGKSTAVCGKKLECTCGGRVSPP
jgi:hypothetical protein